MKHIIFAHSHCTDGLCAASIMKRAINICLNTEDIVVIFARYGAEKKALEQAEIDDKTDVYIVDFSFSVLFLKLSNSAICLFTLS